MHKLSGAFDEMQLEDKCEAILRGIIDNENYALMNGVVVDTHTHTQENSQDGEDEEYKEDTDLKVLKIYEEGEVLPVLKPFLGKTTDYGNFKELLTGKTPSEQSTALQNIIKSYDRSSGENKELLSQLFANLLQYINDLFSNLKDEKEISKSFLILESIAPQLYKIAQIDGVSSRKSFAELLTEKYNEYQKKPQQIPDLDTLIFFRLVSPTSDFPNNHRMAKPCFNFMSEILSTCKFQNARSISRGLFVSALMLEYTSLKNMYMPAGINFVRGLLYLSNKTTIQRSPPFNFHGDAKILILEDDCSKLDFGMRISPKDLFTDSIDNGFKIRTLLTTVLLLEEFFDNCDENEQTFIFEAHKKILKTLKTDLYPEKVSGIIQKTIKYIVYESTVGTVNLTSLDH